MHCIEPHRDIGGRTARSLLAGALVWLTLPVSAQTPQPPLPTVELQAGIHVIRAELADTPASQTVGLMYRRRLDGNDGMLFVFERAEAHCFWMRNTLIPLSIAFLDEDGTVVNIARMMPRSDDTHCAQRPVRHALEMSQGWFEKRGVAPGDRLRAPGVFRAR
ncbi:MAG: DUF192 domain-containing protein [Burkholderiaceae bacterium]|nr:DUF192 domain-containing protein [Burkholderiaceae bacterium]